VSLVAVNSSRNGSGEYPLQDGFAWTNGVSIALLRSYPDPAPRSHRRRTEDPDEPDQMTKERSQPSLIRCLERRSLRLELVRAQTGDERARNQGKQRKDRQPQERQRCGFGHQIEP
jgi:hypothetical protein